MSRTCTFLAAALLAAVPTAAHAGTALRLDVDDLEPLGSGFLYEGWLLVDGQPVSTGTFRVDGSGNAIPATVAVDSGAAKSASHFVVTIEPANDVDPGPSATHVLAGAFDTGSATLTIDAPQALGTDFAGAAGSYILETPSTGGTPMDYDQGIWWLMMTPDGPAPSLDLPMLPEGWAYEGWVAGPDGPISTGRFLHPDMMDSDGAGMTAGPDGSPPFPGQDFISPPMVLTGGYAAVISVEPEPDDSPGPFALKPLVDMDIEDMGQGGAQEMGNHSGSAPSGMATLHSAVKMLLRADGLEDLGADYLYEGWLIVDGAPVSTGRFSVDADGVPETRTFIVSNLDARAASTFVLTIEPAYGDDPAPAATHYLAGDFVKHKATLSIDHPAALDTDFSDVYGAYILETPSTSAMPGDYDQGIWWLMMTPDGPAPALDLPELPAGWVYEGWVAGPMGAISTGRFTATDAADFDGAGMAAGPDGSPPFPGQDFIDPALMLPGMAAVISVEPEPDNSPAPFTLKPLIDGMIEDVGPGAVQGMDDAAPAAPTGAVRYRGF